MLYRLTIGWFVLFSPTISLIQGLAILAFNDGKFNSKTLREALSLGPTFVVMKFIQSRFLYIAKCFVWRLLCFPGQNWYKISDSFEVSRFANTLFRENKLFRLVYWTFLSLSVGVLDIVMMYGAYSTSRRSAVLRIFIKFVWFSSASVVICFLYVYANIEMFLVKPSMFPYLLRILTADIDFVSIFQESSWGEKWTK